MHRVHHRRAVRREIGIGGALAVGEPALPATRELHQVQVVVGGELAPDLGRGDDGLPHRTEREGAVRVHVHQAPAVAPVERDAPQPGPLLGARVEVDEAAPIRQPAGMEHLGAAPGERASLRHRPLSDGRQLRPGPLPERGAEVGPERVEVRAEVAAGQGVEAVGP